MPAGQVQINIGLSAASYTQGLQAIQKQTQQFGNAAKAASRDTVGSMQAASASIRALENPMSLNIRTLARFAAQSKALQGIFQAAFPVVGVLAAGALVAKLGMEVAKFIKTTQGMPKAIELGFGALNLATKTSIDELQLVNDKLDNAHAKFEKKVQNNAKIQIDEARLAMDKFAASIESGNAKLSELLGRTHVSGWAALLGQSGTADREGTVKAFNQQIDGNAYDLANAAPNSKEAAAAKNALMASIQSQINEAKRDRGLRLGGEKGDGADKEGNNILIDQGVITDRQNQLKLLSAQETNAADLTRQQKDEASKAASDQAKEANKARLAAMEAALNAEKLDHNVSVKEEFDYWSQRISTFKEKSEEYNTIQRKQVSLNSAAVQRGRAELKQLATEQKHSGIEDAVVGPEIINRYARESRNNALSNANTENQGYVDDNQYAMDLARNEAKDKEAKLNDEAGRSMSRYAAAVQLAAVHVQEYVTIQESLQAILDIRQKQFDTDPNKETERNLTAAKMGVANAATNRSIQQNSDNDTINGRSTFAVDGFNDAINEFVTASKDAAAQMRDLTLNTIQGLNQTIQHVLTTPHMTGLQTRTAFRDYGAGVASNVVGTGLQKVEGSVLGAFGGGKLGTRANPMVVTFADGTTSAGAASGIGGMIGKLFGGGGSSPQGPGMAGLSQALGQSSEAADNDAAGGVSSIVSTFAGMIPFLATGGSINGPAIVGEQGPELFMPSGAGTIIPNHKLKSSSSSGTSNAPVIHIDATGSNDPAQTEAAVHRAMGQYIPLIAANTIKTQREQTMRKPPSAGR